MLREKKHEIFQRKGTAVRHCGNDGPQPIASVAIEQGKRRGRKVSNIGDKKLWSGEPTELWAAADQMAERRRSWNTHELKRKEIAIGTAILP
jgi:hypothetical protein